MFDLLVRVVPEGLLSQRIAELRSGDEIAFRGPTGRSMVPRDGGRDLILLTTGTGVAPAYSLARHLLGAGYPQSIVLWWGLRLREDVCLTEEPDDLTPAAHANFRYEVSLSRPSPEWTGLQGRLGASVPPRLPTLGGKRFYLIGNGAMLGEMALALSDLGVDQKFIYKEAFFNALHEPDQAVVAGIRERFVATDLYSAYANRRGTAFDLDLDTARSGKAGTGDPLAVSDLFDLMPTFLSHHPDQAAPAPVESRQPWRSPGG